MKPVMCVPEDMSDSIAEFLRSRDMGVEVVTQGDCAVRVVRSEGRVESDESTLQAGGWIKCEVARAVAAKLNTRFQDFGAMLDFLHVKIRECELGCF